MNERAELEMERIEGLEGVLDIMLLLRGISYILFASALMCGSVIWPDDIRFPLSLTWYSSLDSLINLQSVTWCKVC